MSSTSARRPLVSVVTPSLPERASLLRECEASVRAQTRGPLEHLIGVDENRVGCARTTNQLAAQAEAPWLLTLADDDLLLPCCVEHLLAVADGAHVVYSPPLVWGEGTANFHGEPPNIPSTALIAKVAWERFGGYRENLVEREDNDLWQRMVRAGLIFRRFDQAPTWVYRFHSSNKSRRH